MDANQLKRLQTSRKELLKKKQDVEGKIKITTNRLSELKEENKEIDSALAQLVKKEKGNDILVTEHALVRLMERVYMLPIKEKEQELKDLLRPMINFNRNGKFPIGSGHRAVVKDGIVITIEPA